ncbi:MAG: hypothetical protein AAB560_00585 [Patescibacteria group bacterium]
MKFAAAIILTLAVLTTDASASGKVLEVKAAVDREYKEYFLFRGDWETHIRTAFEVASREFERQFGKRIVLTEITEWRPLKSKSLFSLLMDLRSRFWAIRVDFVVGFTGKATDYNGAAYQNHYFAAISTIAVPGTPYTLLQNHQSGPR